MNIERIKSITKQIKEKVDFVPELLMVLGSGLGHMAEGIENKIEIKYDSLRDFLVTDVEGHVGQFVFGDYMGKKVVMMQGRFHYYEGHSINESILPIYVMRDLGVEKLIVTNASGGVNESYTPGDLMIIEDHINFTGQNPLIGPNLDEFGPRFPDMSRAYDRDYMALTEKIAKKQSLDIKKGVYAMYTGPSYETPAEIKSYRLLGADAIGMSTVPEVIAANHAGMRVLGISCITNMASGILDTPLSHEDVIKVSNKVKDVFTSLVSEIIKEI